MSRGSGQLVPQNATMAGCPAQPFYETHSRALSLIDGEVDKQIMCPPRHVK